MRKRIVWGSVIFICLALVAVLFIGSNFFSAVNGSGSMTVGDTSVTYERIGDRIVLVIWSDANGPSGSGGESDLFASSASGFFSSVDGKRINWEWKNARDRGGDFRIDGMPHDLSRGAMMLVSTKGGQIRVTQLDVDLSKIDADRNGFEALARDDPKVAKFIADASGRP